MPRPRTKHVHNATTSAYQKLSRELHGGQLKRAGTFTLAADNARIGPLLRLLEREKCDVAFLPECTTVPLTVEGGAAVSVGENTYEGLPRTAVDARLEDSISIVRNRHSLSELGGLLHTLHQLSLVTTIPNAADRAHAEKRLFDMLFVRNDAPFRVKPLSDATVPREPQLAEQMEARARKHLDSKVLEFARALRIAYDIRDHDCLLDGVAEYSRDKGKGFDIRMLATLPVKVIENDLLRLRLLDSVLGYKAGDAARTPCNTRSLRQKCTELLDAYANEPPQPADDDDNAPPDNPPYGGEDDDDDGEVEYASASSSSSSTSSASSTSPSSSSSSASSPSSTPTDCTTNKCGKDSDRMVCCEICNAWYHDGCVDLSGITHFVDEFICPKVNCQRGRRTTYKSGVCLECSPVQDEPPKSSGDVLVCETCQLSVHASCLGVSKKIFDSIHWWLCDDCAKESGRRTQLHTPSCGLCHNTENLDTHWVCAECIQYIDHTIDVATETKCSFCAQPNQMCDQVKVCRGHNCVEKLALCTVAAQLRTSTSYRYCQRGANDEDKDELIEQTIVPLLEPAELRNASIDVRRRLTAAGHTFTLDDVDGAVTLALDTRRNLLVERVSSSPDDSILAIRRRYTADKYTAAEVKRAQKFVAKSKHLDGYASVDKVVDEQQLALREGERDRLQHDMAMRLCRTKYAHMTDDELTTKYTTATAEDIVIARSMVEEYSDDFYDHSAKRSGVWGLNEHLGIVKKRKRIARAPPPAAKRVKVVESCCVEVDVHVKEKITSPATTTCGWTSVESYRKLGLDEPTALSRYLAEVAYEHSLWEEEDRLAPRDAGKCVGQSACVFGMNQGLTDDDKRQ